MVCHTVLILGLAASLIGQQEEPAGKAAVLPPQVALLPTPIAALPNAHFKQLRDQLRGLVGDGVVLLRGANKPSNMLAFGQDQSFWYLSGIAEPGLAMLLGTQGDMVLDELLVPPFSRFEAQWNGEFLAPGEAAEKRTGFKKVSNVRQLSARLDELLMVNQDGKRRVLFTLLQPEAGPGGTSSSAGQAAKELQQDPFDGRMSREATLQSSLTAKYEGLLVKDLTPILAQMRVHKTAFEITLLQASAEIAAYGHIEAMRSARPLLREFQVAAVARYVFSLHGASSDAYGAIVGAGKNGCILHYMKNDAELKDGDLVVMDYAATVLGYAADVTRTFPANGKFTPQQRKLVQDIYFVQQALIKEVKPGASLSALSKLCSELLLLRGYKTDHGPCHHVGLAVHDPSVDLLTSGMVITVEPGAYLRDQGMGCRIEDTVLVTEDGCRVLSGGAPSKPEDIELLMSKPGITDLPVGVVR